MKGVVSAQNALLKGSKTKARDLLEGTEEYNILPEKGSLIFPPGKPMISFTKKETEKH